MPHLQGALCTTTIQDFSVHIGARALLTHVNLELHCGEITALIGPNGAGKTTLLTALLGLFPHEGRVVFTDADGHAARPPRIGYVPQRLNFDRMAPGTVADLFAASLSRRPAFFGHSKKTREIARGALRAVEAEHLLDEQLGSLSGGETQRATLALALTPTPDLLLLDEPVSGVDASGLRMFYRMVDHVRDSCDLTCVLVSHDLHAVSEIADRVVLLNERVLAQGSPEQVYRSAEFRALFGAEKKEGCGVV